jgi:hypothetical protein
MADFFAEAAAWAEGRWWQWRAPLLALLAWDGVRHLRDAEQGGFFAGITFGVHEFGHLLFAFFGEFMTVLGGSLTQLLIPLATALLLYRSRDFFGIAVAGAWLSSSLIDLARYIGDARTLDLDLVGFGENAVHDWAFLLGRVGWLPYDVRLASLTRGIGVVVLLASLGFGGWLVLQMGRRGEGGTARAG